MTNQASVTATGPYTKGWRVDIQSLRGLAVLLVVLDHAKFPYLKGGFLGVDIFFVISGFLMTGLIVDALDKRAFTLREFYARRVRRLLPAAYATIVLTALISPFLLDPHELRNLFQQVGGAFSFSTNFVLWKQIDYFDNDSTLKPLLHLWSLAVEEQYYIIIPFILMFCPKRWRISVGIALVILSLGLCLYYVQRSPSAAFYFLPFRAWELGIGSVAALLIRRFGILRFGGWPLRLTCASGILVLAIFCSQAGHPGWAAFTICLLTAWLMVSGEPQAKAGMLAPITYVGDRSYTLYLVHWPVLAFANNVYLGPPPPLVTVGMLVIAVIWMELQYRFIEQQFRSLKINLRSIAVLVLIPVLTIVGLYLVSFKFPDYRKGNPGLAAECNYKGTFNNRDACKSQPGPQTLLWGDSIAMNLAQGLDATTPGGIVQATSVVCGPFLGVAPMNDTLRTRAWAEKCIRFNNSVVAYLKEHPEIHTVVLSSVLRPYLPHAEVGHWHTLREGTDGYLEGSTSETYLFDGLQKTVTTLHAMGRRVVLVAPPPSVDYDIGRCLGRLEAHVPTISKNPTCNFSTAYFHTKRKPILDFLAAAQSQGLVEVISFEPFLCQTGECQTRISSTPLYVDGAHFTVQGSRLIGEGMKLGKQVAEKAK